MAFGRPITALQRLADADVIVSLDADPLGAGPLQIVQRARVRRSPPSAKGRRRHRPALRRRIRADPDRGQCGSSSRAAAERRSRTLRSRSRARLAPPCPRPLWRRTEAAFQTNSRATLSAHKGRALVIAGPTLAPDVHALCHWINAQLQAPIDYLEADGEAPPSSLTDLVRDCEAGKVDSLFILGCNPAYDAPPDLGFAQAIGKAKFRAHLGCYFDETAALCEWHIPQRISSKAGPILRRRTARRASCSRSSRRSTKRAPSMRCSPPRTAASRRDTNSCGRPGRPARRRTISRTGGGALCMTGSSRAPRAKQASSLSPQLPQLKSPRRLQS